MPLTWNPAQDGAEPVMLERPDWLYFWERIIYFLTRRLPCGPSNRTVKKSSNTASP